MKIIRKKSFCKAYEKLQKPFQKKVDEVLLLFSKNPTDSTLRNHALKGKLIGLRSLDVTGDLRIIFEEKDEYIIVVLVTIGTHSQLY